MEERQRDQEINEATHQVVRKAKIYKKIKSAEMPFPTRDGYILYKLKVSELKEKKKTKRKLPGDKLVNDL